MNPKLSTRLIWAGYGLLLIYWAFRLRGHFPAFMDTIEYVFPEKWVNVAQWQAGNIPLWNPWIACGVPHLANLQSAPFYPFFWIWNWTGLSDWFFWVALGHSLLMAAGFYLWLRSQETGETLSSLGAVGFGGSALAVQYWGFPTHLATLAWLPWIFWATFRLYQKPSLIRWAAVVVFWSLDLLAGYVYFTFYMVFFTGLWIFIKLKPGKKFMAAYLSAALAVLGLTACQWMPFADFLGYLHRTAFFDPIYSLNWKNFRTLLQPDLLGIPGTAAYGGDYPDYIFNNFYLGLVPLAAFLWMAASASNRRTGFWKGASLFCLLWTAGVHFPLWNLLPGKILGAVDPAKSAFLFIFCAFTLACLGLQEWLDSASKKNIIRRWAPVLGALWILEIFFIPFRMIHLVPDPYRDPRLVQAAGVVREAQGAGRLVGMHLANFLNGGPAEGLSTAVDQTLLGFPPNTNAVWGLRSASGYLSIYPDGYQDLQSYMEKGFPYDGRILDAAGVSLFILQDRLTPFKYRAAGQWGPFILNSNAGAMADVWPAALVREFPDRPLVFTALLDSGAFLENQVYTEKAGDGKALRLPPAGRELPGAGEPGWFSGWEAFWHKLFQNPAALREDRLSPCRVQFKADLRDPGYVVFNETFVPGWRAWVDGKPCPIFRADGLFMAVLTPENGIHQVEFRYEPAAFRLGLFLSLFFVTFFPLVLWKLKKYFGTEIPF